MIENYILTNFCVCCDIIYLFICFHVMCSYKLHTLCDFVCIFYIYFNIFKNFIAVHCHSIYSK